MTLPRLRIVSVEIRGGDIDVLAGRGAETDRHGVKAAGAADLHRALVAEPEHGLEFRRVVNLPVDRLEHAMAAVLRNGALPDLRDQRPESAVERVTLQHVLNVSVEIPTDDRARQDGLDPARLVLIEPELARGATDDGDGLLVVGPAAAVIDDLLPFGVDRNGGEDLIVHRHRLIVILVEGGDLFVGVLVDGVDLRARVGAQIEVFGVEGTGCLEARERRLEEIEKLLRRAEEPLGQLLGVVERLWDLGERIGIAALRGGEQSLEARLCVPKRHGRRERRRRRRRQARREIPQRLEVGFHPRRRTSP